MLLHLICFAERQVLESLKLTAMACWQMTCPCSALHAAYRQLDAGAVVVSLLLSMRLWIEQRNTAFCQLDLPNITEAQGIPDK